MTACRFLLPLVCLLWCTTTRIYAQEVVWNRFLLLLGNAGIDYQMPSDAGYQEIETAKNPFQHCDYAMYSRQEKMEIRFLIRPMRDTLVPDNPYIRSMALAMHLAKNEAPSPIAMHQLPEAPYHADWGAAYFFQPKPVFGAWQHCKMLAMYKEGHGMFYVFYLFNEADKSLENREVLLQFLE